MSDPADHATPVPDGGRHAVVIGASMAGLCMAAALADTFHRVTVLDRDRLSDRPTPRAGVPQGRHVHVLLPPGAVALASLFPGLLDELTAAGATTVPTERVRACLNGHRLAPASTGHSELGASRPLLEAQVRARVRDHPSIELVEGTEALGLQADADRRRVTGVRTRARATGGPTSCMPAELVVDCSGRRSATPGWLEQLGYAAPDVEQVDVDVHYATRHYRLSPDALGGDQHILVGPMPDAAAGGVLLAVEDGRWVATLFGMCDTRPSLDPEEFERFAARLPIGDLHTAISAGEPLDEPTGFRFPANRRRRYERLGALPAGLLMAGDAVCSFNPIYGQGMTVAALEATILRRLLADEGVPDGPRWLAAITPTIDIAWELAVGADLGVDCVPGDRSPAQRLQQAYVRSFHRAARHDATLTARFWGVAGLSERPTSLLRPAVVARVARGALRRR